MKIILIITEYFNSNKFITSRNVSFPNKSLKVNINMRPLLVNFNQMNVNGDTPTTKQALNSAERTSWLKVICDKFTSLESKGTWRVVDRLPKGCNMVGSRRVLRRKRLVWRHLQIQSQTSSTKIHPTGRLGRGRNFTSVIYQITTCRMFRFAVHNELGVYLVEFSNI